MIKTSNANVHRENSSPVLWKDGMIPRKIPTVARQGDASLCVIIVRKVGAAVGTCPVPVAHTLELIAADLKPKGEPAETSVPCTHNNPTPALMTTIKNRSILILASCHTYG